MSGKNNFIAEFIVKNTNPKYFNILSKNIFICSFITIFGLGIFFSFLDAKLCRVDGKLQLNPIYTPKKILENEFFILKEIAKDFPQITWDKQNFTMVGNKDFSPKFCAETIEKFEKSIDENYNKIFIKILNSESQKILVDMMDKFLNQNKTIENPNFSSQINEFRNEHFILQKDLFLNNKDKYIFNWKYKNKLSISYLGLQFFYCGILAFLFSIILQTLFDLFRLIKSKKN